MISPESELLARLEKMEQALAALSIQNGTLRSENARLEAENRLLRVRIDKLVRRIFGRSSEKISPEQLELLLQLPGVSVPGAERSETDSRRLPAGRAKRVKIIGLPVPRRPRR